MVEQQLMWHKTLPSRSSKAVKRNLDCITGIIVGRTLKVLVKLLSHSFTWCLGFFFFLRDGNYQVLFMVQFI